MQARFLAIRCTLSLPGHASFGLAWAALCTVGAAITLTSHSSGDHPQTYESAQWRGDV